MAKSASHFYPPIRIEKIESGLSYEISIGICGSDDFTIAGSLSEKQADALQIIIRKAMDRAVANCQRAAREALGIPKQE